MGYVADIFDEPHAVGRCPARCAIGHVRYSTAGESRLANAQPILIDCAHGQIAICHNGNLVNAQRAARRPGARQGRSSRPAATPRSSLHLYARSQAPAASRRRVVESVTQVRGAFSLVDADAAIG